MCLFTSARTVAIVFARSAGSDAMYCAGVLTFAAGFMDSSFSRTKCISELLKTNQRALLTWRYLKRSFEMHSKQIRRDRRAVEQPALPLSHLICPLFLRLHRRPPKSLKAKRLSPSICGPPA